MSKKSENQSEVAFVSSLAEASFLVRRVAEPVPSGDSTKAAILRASRRLRWSFSRVKNVWYGDHRVRITADELAQLRLEIRRRKTDDARHTVAEARELIARLEQCIRLQNPDLDREELSQAFGLARGEDSSLGE